MDAFWFGIALIAYGISAFFYTMLSLFGRLTLGKLAVGVAIAGVICHTMGLIIRTIDAGHAPFTNLYESLVFSSWSMVTFYLLIEYRYKAKVIGGFVTWMAFLTIGYASLLPDRVKQVTPLVPALQSHWLEFHVAACFLAYAAFAVAFGCGIVYLCKSMGRRQRRQKLHSENQEADNSSSTLDMIDNLSYKTIRLGIFLLTIGIITGAVWANYSWGTYWSWDPKETWALVTWIIYIIYLHVRITPAWHGKMAAWLAIIGFVAVIFTYLGVNLLMKGLHSYI
ncbi:MAG: c-type cytochrome biogenesis protein CcsB [bacterium]|nr:c-type cytochrome biogenesis protein CcsB [bacterium]